MVSLIISSGAPLFIGKTIDVTTANVTFTAAQWSAFVAQVNNEAFMALVYGLIIGAIAGAAGLYCGMWYRGRQG